MSETSKVALDANVLIATVCSWHEHHATTFHYLRRLQSGGADLLIPGHALLEAYSVLTRLLAPHRVPPEIAANALRAAFESCRLVSMPAVGWREIEWLAKHDVRGGRVYDALIAEAAARAKAGCLLTWNPDDFVSLAPASLTIQVPR